MVVSYRSYLTILSARYKHKHIYVKLQKYLLRTNLIKAMNILIIFV